MSRVASRRSEVAPSTRSELSDRRDRPKPRVPPLAPVPRNTRRVLDPNSTPTSRVHVGRPLHLAPTSSRVHTSRMAEQADVEVMLGDSFAHNRAKESPVVTKVPSPTSCAVGDFGHAYCDHRPALGAGSTAPYGGTELVLDLLAVRAARDRPRDRLVHDCRQHLSSSASSSMSTRWARPPAPWVSFATCSMPTRRPRSDSTSSTTTRSPDRSTAQGSRIFAW